MSHYEALVSHLADIFYLGRALSLLEWDVQVNLPSGGYAARGAQLATLTRMRHELFTGDTTARLLDAAAGELNGADPDGDAVRLVQVVREDYNLATRLPAAFVAELTRLTTEAHEVWARARANNDFKTFEPMLRQIVDLMRQRADYLGYSEHPYDALLGEYERGMTTAQVKAIFDGHRPQLVDLVKAIQARGREVDASMLHQPLDEGQQKQFARWAAETIGFDFTRGRQDVAVHPFAMPVARTDVRLTTRFYPDFLNPALFGMLHEAGHGMYEQGSAEALEGTPLAGGTSLGVHESQSRLWENIVGRSRNFWTYALPHLQATFPGQFDNVDVETFYRAVNRVAPSYIRVEADEATYNLHIMLRFELETALLKGEVQVANLPDEWNQRFEAYVGLTPPDDAHGVLQDVHWSAGLVGYFPTYALGNLLSVQYYNQALTAHPSIPDEIAQGNCATLLTWLRENIYQHGRKFNTAELTQRVTGSQIDAGPYIAYLQQKYTDIYGL